MVKTSSRRGFTILEALLFLAITALIFAGLMVGVTTSIARHRYNDSVQEIVDFFRIAYDDVIYTHNTRLLPAGGPDYCSLSSIIHDNVHLRFNSNEWLDAFPYGQTAAAGYRGRSNCSVYGQLLVFGEDDNNTVYQYPVTGKYLTNPDTARPATAVADDTLYALGTADNAVFADVVSMRVKDLNINPGETGPTNAVATCHITSASASYDFESDTGEDAHHLTLRWGGYFQTPDGQDFKGAILIVRSPIDGVVHTYFYNQPIYARHVIENDENRFDLTNCTGNTVRNLYTRAVSDNALLAPRLSQFKKQTVDICINSDDARAINGRRRNIRISLDGHNSSAVELVAADDDSAEGNKCN